MDDPKTLKPDVTNSAANAIAQPAADAASETPSPNAPNGEVSAVDRLVSMAGKQDEGSMREKAEEQVEQINDQMDNRPLLQKQKMLDAAEEEAKASPAVEAAAELLAEDGDKKDDDATPHSKYGKH